MKYLTPGVGVDVDCHFASGYDVPRILCSLDAAALTGRGMVGRQTLGLVLSVVARLEAL